MKIKRNTGFLLVIVAVCFLITGWSACDKKSKGSLQLRAVNSMQRIKPYEQVNGAEAVEIKAAKNEYEAFQVVIIAARNQALHNVVVEISDLSGENGIIGRDNMTLYRPKYIQVRNSSPKASRPPGLYPDPLMPFNNPYTGESIPAMRSIRGPQGLTFEGAKFSAQPINVFAGQNQSIWVDIYVPNDTPAGTYTGTFKMTAARDISAEIPITLTVWDFTLPETATHRTHFGHFSRIASVWGIDRESEKYQNIELRFCKALAEHRINPPLPHSLLPKVNEDGSLTIVPSRHAKLKKYIQDTRLKDFEVPRARFMTSTSNSPRPTPANQTDPVAIEKTKRYYREYYHYLKENGWEERAYLYMLDEPNSIKDYQQVINLGTVVKEAVPQLKCLVVEQTYKHNPSWPDLDAIIDIWCPLFGFIDRETIQEKIKNGDQVWSYTALVQPAPPYHPDYELLKEKNPPYWHIDQPVMVYRIPLWINWQYNIKGLLYWTSVNWYQDNDPWTEPVFGPYGVSYYSDDPSAFQGRYYNGGGLLFYPGKDAGIDGPVTSIRLKNLREGLEDYEYFILLEQKGQKEFVRKTMDQVCPDWWNYSHDVNAYYKAREILAQKIVELNSN